MTPAVEAAKRAGIEFRLHEYEGVEVGDGDYAVAVAAAVGRPAEQLFKTLVASVDGRLEVFVVPADRQLDLRAVGKRTTLAAQADAERATGYVVGGISPLGQRRRLPTTVDESALAWDTILVSAGRRGLQIELAPDDLVRLTVRTSRRWRRDDTQRRAPHRLCTSRRRDPCRGRSRSRRDRERFPRRRRRRLRRRDAARDGRTARSRRRASRLPRAAGLERLGSWGPQGPETSRVSGCFEEIPFELIWWSREYADAAINVGVARRGRDRERRLATDVRPPRRLAGAAQPLPGRARCGADRGRGADVGRVRGSGPSDDRAARRAALARRTDGRRRGARPPDGLRDQQRPGSRRPSGSRCAPRPSRSSRPGSPSESRRRSPSPTPCAHSSS